MFGIQFPVTHRRVRVRWRPVSQFVIRVVVIAPVDLPATSASSTEVVTLLALATRRNRRGRLRRPRESLLALDAGHHGGGAGRRVGHLRVLE